MRQLLIVIPILAAAGAAQSRLEPLRVAAPGDPYTGISGEYMYARVREIVSFSHEARRDGLKIWGRVAGTQYAHRTADYMAGQFRQLGIDDVRADRFPTGYPQWWPVEYEVKLAGGRPLESAMPAHPAGAHPDWGSPPTPPEGIEAEMVYVGLGSPADLVGKDLRGKIAVLRSLPWPSVASHTGQAAAPRLKGRGHVGMVVIMDIPGNYTTAANFLCGMGPCEVPTFQVGSQDGEALERAIVQGGARLHLRLSLETKRGLEGRNVMATLPGATDEYIVLFAHSDGWFDGANDNAGGLAAQLALARYFISIPKAERRRSLLFVVTEGHHAGSPGAAHFVKQYQPILARTALVLNCEHLAATLAVRAGDRLVYTNTESPRSVMIAKGNAALTSAVADAVARYGITAGQDIIRDRYVGDATPFRGTSAPLVSIMDTSLLGYHISGDLEIVTPQGLERAVRAYAYIIDRVNNIRQ